MFTPEVKLYVQSDKKETGRETVVVETLDRHPAVHFTEYKGADFIRFYPKYETKTVTKYDYVLPEEQERIVQIVRDEASKLGFNLEIIDVTKREVFDGAIPKQVKKLKNFPVLETKSETRLILGCSRTDVERFLLDVKAREKCF